MQEKATNYFFRTKNDRFAEEEKDHADIDKLSKIINNLSASTNGLRLDGNFALYNNFKLNINDGIYNNNPDYNISTLITIFNNINDDMKLLIDGSLILQGLDFDPPMFYFVASGLENYVERFEGILNRGDEDIVLNSNDKDFALNFVLSAGMAYQAFHHCQNARMEGVITFFSNFVSSNEQGLSANLNSEQLIQILFSVSFWDQVLRYIKFAESEENGRKIYNENATLFGEAIQCLGERYAVMSKNFRAVTMYDQYRAGLKWYLSAVYPEFWNKLKDMRIASAGTYLNYEALVAMGFMGRGTISVPSQADIRFQQLVNGVIDLAMSPENLVPYMFSKYSSMIFSSLNKYKDEKKDRDYDVATLTQEDKKIYSALFVQKKVFLLENSF